MRRVVESWYRGEGATTRDALVRGLCVPGEAVDRVVAALVAAGLLARNGPEAAGCYLPALPPESTSVKRVLDAVRACGGSHHLLTGATTPEGRVMDTLDAALEERLGPITVAELAQSGEDGTRRAPGPPGAPAGRAGDAD